MQILRFYFSPFGRVSRKGLWLGFVVPYFLLSAVVIAFLASLFESEQRSDPALVADFIAEWLLVLLPILFVVWWASLVTMVKRLHDRNISALWLLPMALWVVLGNGLMRFYPENFQGFSSVFFILALIVMTINLWLAINAYFMRGTRGVNRFGPDPLGGNV